MPSTSISSTRPSAATGEGMALFQAAGMGTNHREPTRKGRKPYGPEGVVIGKDADINGVAEELADRHRACCLWKRALGT
jgi:hypothetical protein